MSGPEEKPKRPPPPPGKTTGAKPPPSPAPRSIPAQGSEAAATNEECRTPRPTRPKSRRPPPPPPSSPREEESEADEGNPLIGLVTGIGLGLAALSLALGAVVVGMRYAQRSQPVAVAPPSALESQSPAPAVALAMRPLSGPASSPIEPGRPNPATETARSSSTVATLPIAERGSVPKESPAADPAGIEPTAPADQAADPQAADPEAKKTAKAGALDDLRAHELLLPLPPIPPSGKSDVQRLAAIEVDSAADCVLKLKGRDVSAGNRKFVLAAEDRPEGARVWTVSSRPANGLGKETLAGQFSFRDRALWFQWQASSGTSPCASLRFCILSVAAGGEEVDCRLAASQKIEALRISLQSPAGTIDLPLDRKLPVSEDLLQLALKLDGKTSSEAVPPAGVHVGKTCVVHVGSPTSAESTSRSLVDLELTFKSEEKKLSLSYEAFTYPPSGLASRSRGKLKISAATLAGVKKKCEDDAQKASAMIKAIDFHHDKIAKSLGTLEPTNGRSTTVPEGPDIVVGGGGAAAPGKQAARGNSVAPGNSMMPMGPVSPANYQAAMARMQETQILQVQLAGEATKKAAQESVLKRANDGLAWVGEVEQVIQELNSGTVVLTYRVYVEMDNEEVDLLCAVRSGPAR